jgi:hypothetical protein
VENPRLDEQGDGVRSYAGILFEAIAFQYDVVMIDEPEAILHPPQIRRLAATLASEVSGQLLVATHSSDIVRGFLSGGNGSVRVIRLRRDGAESKITEVKPEKIKDLWSRPELRYSNALDALFHECAIICEDESDCKLFNSVADYLQSESGQRWPDASYIPSGGKHGAPKISEILYGAGVPVKQIFDIDFLSEKELVKRSVEAVGGSWSAFEPLLERFYAEALSGVKPLSNEEIAAKINEILSKVGPDDNIPRSEINETLKQRSAWQIIKRSGEHALPKGSARSTFKGKRSQDLTVSLA